MQENPGIFITLYNFKKYKIAQPVFFLFFKGKTKSLKKTFNDLQNTSN